MKPHVGKMWVVIASIPSSLAWMPIAFANTIQPGVASAGASGSSTATSAQIQCSFDQPPIPATFVVPAFTPVELPAPIPPGMEDDGYRCFSIESQSALTLTFNGIVYQDKAPLTLTVQLPDICTNDLDASRSSLQSCERLASGGGNIALCGYLPAYSSTAQLIGAGMVDDMVAEARKDGLSYPEILPDQIFTLMDSAGYQISVQFSVSSGKLLPTALTSGQEHCTIAQP